MRDLLRPLPWGGESRCRMKHVGLAIGRLALRQQGADFGQRVRPLQERPVRLRLHPLPDRLRRGDQPERPGHGS